MTQHPIALAIALAFTTSAALSGCDRVSGLTEQEHIQRAKDFEDQGNVKGSIIELKNAVQKSPDSAQARLMLGQVYLKTGMAAEAEKELIQAEKLGVSRESIRLQLGEAWIQMGEYKRVLDEIQPDSQASRSSLARIQQLRADALLRLGKLEDACSLFQQSLETDKNNSATYWGMAQCAISEHDMAKAKEWLNAALEVDPGNVKTWILLGDFERHNSNAQGAESAYTQALKLSPNSEVALASRALTRFSQSQNAQAQEDLNKLQSLAPSSAITQFLQAVSLYHSGKLNESLDMLMQAQRLQPSNPPALRLLGIVHYRLGNFEQASQHLTRYLQQAPGDLDARKLLASAHIQLNQPERALELLLPALASGTPDSQLLALASAAHLRDHDLTESTRLLQQAITLEPQNVALRTQLGLNLWAAGEKQEAQQALAKAATQDQQQYQADFALALMYLQQQQFDQALRAVSGLEKKRPDDPLTHNLKGAAYLGLRDFTMARKSFERALVLQPTSASAALNLAQLDLQDKKPAAARQRFEQILANDKNNVQALLGLAGLAAGSGNEQEYIGYVEKAVQIKPPALQPRILLIKYYLNKNQTQKALALARETQSSFPRHPAALEQLGTAQFAAGEKENALSTFKKLVETTPDSPTALFRLASIQATLGQYDASRTSLKRSLAIAPGYLDAKIALIKLDVRAGKHSDALKIAQQIRTDNPKSTLGTVLEGDIHMSQKQFSLAADSYERAWAREPSGPLVIKRHQALSEMGRKKEADLLLQKWLDDHPQDKLTRSYQQQITQKPGAQAPK
jgi:putative PEP-CTERM system TPR-repeat lipoprotein